MNESNYLIFEKKIIRKLLSILQKEVRWGLSPRDKEFLRPKDLKPKLGITHKRGSWF